LAEPVLILMVAGVLAALFVAVAISYLADAVRDRKAFEERFPPISDAEFLCRCPPGTTPDVTLRVRRIVAEKLAVDYRRVCPSSRFVDDLAAD
jgi:hypothetical protein